MKIEQSAAIAGFSASRDSDEVRENRQFQAFLEEFDAGQGATSSPSGGIATLGLLGWVEYERRQQAEEAARAEVMERWGLENLEDVEALSVTERNAFEAEVQAVKEERLAQALKEGALEEMREKESVLYRNTPFPEEDDGNIAF